MKSLEDINAASTAKIKDALARDVAINKKASASYYGFIAQHGKHIPFLTPARLAEILEVSLKTLERWRKAKSGPPFMRTATGRIRYPVVELEQWARENMTCQDSPESTTTNSV